MLAHETAGLAAIEAVYGIGVFYEGAGLASAEIRAIKSDVAADSFQGAGNTLREISFEVDATLLPDEPRKKDLIEEVESGERWSVIDRTWLSAVRRWRLVVEEAEA